MLNEILNMSLEEMSGHAYPKTEADSVEIEYKLNSHGYRCDEFNNQEILILGCSQTEGHGLPLELTWPYLISKKMNKEYISLAKGGDGAQAQISKAFQFFKEFYNPKYIFAAFPLTRLEVPLMGVKSRIPFNGKVGKGMFENKLVEKFSKFPHTAENVLSEEFVIFYNIMFIKMLIQYCKSNNITLIWFHYYDTSVEIPSFKNLSEGYWDSAPLNLDSSTILTDCHKEFSDNIFFDYAADYKYWPPGHWSFHKQIHISEKIYDILTQLQQQQPH